MSMKKQENQVDTRYCLYCGKIIEKGKFCTKSHEYKYYEQNRRRIKITLNHHEYEQLKKEAAQLNITLSALVKYRALNKKSDHLKENVHLTKLRAELGKIGSNYNQIAHRLNQLKYSQNISDIDYFDMKKILSQHSKQHFEKIWEIFEYIKKDNE